jgi:fermentation-respiration switch protein FrsA (DUF1100 family)
MKLMTATAAILLLIALACAALFWVGQRRLIYYPAGEVAPVESVGLTDAREVSMPVEDGGTIAGWFVAAAQPRYTVIVFNGNAGNRAYRAPLAAALRDRGFNVLLFDYRGFGGNPGVPTERGLAADARAALAQVLRMPGVRADRVVYFGESLGAAVATSLAAGHPPAALVLRSPFTSLAEIGRYHFVLPVGPLLRDRFDSLTTIQRVPVPTLMIAGDRDGIVPLEHSRRLFERSPALTKQWVTIRGTDHNDEALVSGPQMIDAVATFLARPAAQP